jgi:hypothetical protein
MQRPQCSELALKAAAEVNLRLFEQSTRHSGSLRRSTHISEKREQPVRFQSKVEEANRRNQAVGRGCTKRSWLERV